MAGEQGGAVNLVQQRAVSMTRCVFSRNWTPRAGGALFSEGYSVLLDTCVFSGNQAATGGAIYTSGLYPLNPGPPMPGTVLTHCTFTGNYASDAGGALWANPRGLHDRQLHLRTQLGAERGDSCVAGQPDGNNGLQGRHGELHRMGRPEVDLAYVA